MDEILFPVWQIYIHVTSVKPQSVIPMSISSKRCGLANGSPLIVPLQTPSPTRIANLYPESNIGSDILLSETVVLVLTCYCDKFLVPEHCLSSVSLDARLHEIFYHIVSDLKFAVYIDKPKLIHGYKRGTIYLKIGILLYFSYGVHSSFADDICSWILVQKIFWLAFHHNLFRGFDWKLWGDTGLSNDMVSYRGNSIGLDNDVMPLRHRAGVNYS